MIQNTSIYLPFPALYITQRRCGHINNNAFSRVKKYYRAHEGIFKPSLILAAIAGVMAIALSVVNLLTAERIGNQQTALENEARRKVIAADSFARETLTVDGDEVVYYTASRSGTAVGYVFTARVSGKNAGMVVMTGIGIDGEITGVTVTQHSETAGYLDKVTQDGLFDRLAGWNAGRVLEPGTDVDAVSQATKTSIGVVNGVNTAIQYYGVLTGKEVS